MTGIAVEVVINAPIGFVWADLEDISTHVDWMLDAAEIRFLTDQRKGTGTRFECDTVVGPLKLTDIMQITDWVEASTMGVTHQGIVSGTGVFRLTPRGAATEFSWVEELSFPWYFAGPLGAAVARPVLKAIWRGNLQRLKNRIERRWLDERRGTNE
jgi:hypothetical protein